MTIILEQFIGHDPQTVREQLRKEGVAVEPTVQRAIGPLALLHQIQLGRQVWPGSTVRIVTVANVVTGFIVEPPGAVEQALAELRQLVSGRGSPSAGPQE